MGQCQILYANKAQDNKSDSIPSWTGFNIRTRNREVVDKDRLEYMPTINSPAAQLTTHNVVLLQALKIFEVERNSHCHG